MTCGISLYSYLISFLFTLHVVNDLNIIRLNTCGFFSIWLLVQITLLKTGHTSKCFCAFDRLSLGDGIYDTKLLL